MLCSFRFLQGYTNFYFPTPWDDALHIGLSLKNWFELPMDRAPLYVYFIKLMRTLESDPIRLFYFNFAFQTIGLALVSYCLCLRFKINSFVAFILGYFVLISSFNAPVLFSKASHFNLLFLMTIMLVFTYIESINWKLVFLGFFLFLSLYIRLDNFLLICSCVVYFLFDRSSHLSILKRFGLVLVYLLSISISLKFIGSPFLTAKAWDSFADWYYWSENIKQGWFDQDLVASSRDQVWEFIRTRFGDSSELWQAILANPGALLLHGIQNLTLWITQIPIWYLSHVPILNFVSPQFSSAEIVILSAFESSIIFGAILYFYFLNKNCDRLKCKSDDQKWLQVLLFGCFAKAILTSMILAPNVRYSFDFILFFVIYLLSFFIIREMPNAKLFRIFLTTVLILFVPTHTKTDFQDAYSNVDDKMYLDAITLVRQLESKHGEIRIMGTSAFDSYLGRLSRSYSGADFLSQKSGAVDLGKSIESRGIGIIIVEKKLAMSFKAAGKYKDLQEFIEASEVSGFTLVVNKSYKKQWPFQILIKKHLYSF